MVESQVRQWYYAFLNQTRDTLFSQVSSCCLGLYNPRSQDRTHVSRKWRDNVYDREVLHISPMPCIQFDGKVDAFTPGFELITVLCTDGKTIGHHKPGECPFMVPPGPKEELK